MRRDCHDGLRVGDIDSLSFKELIDYISDDVCLFGVLLVAFG
jgi:hypothetical protein